MTSSHILFIPGILMIGMFLVVMSPLSAPLNFQSSPSRLPVWPVLGRFSLSPGHFLPGFALREWPGVRKGTG